MTSSLLVFAGRRTALITAALLVFFVLSLVTIAAVIAAPLPQGQQAQVGPASGCPAWNRTPSPGDGVILAVQAITPNDAWGVGGGSFEGLILHWDGIRWSQMPVPPSGPTLLLAVSAVSASDIWVVGQGGLSANLTIHWDGQQ